MKITFPHMGSVYIASKALVEDLGHIAVPPPRCSKKTLDIGTKYSPESICLPLKINIGNYIESIEKGADTIILTDSYGPCRFGFYSVLEREILKDLGYDVEVIVLGKNPLDFTKNLLRLTRTKNIYKIIKNLKRAGRVINEADSLIKLSNYKRAHAVDSYKVDTIIEDYYRNIENTHGVEETLDLIKITEDKLKNVDEKENYEYIKIGIVGEIYAVIESFVNLEVEKKLGHLGVEVERFHTPSNWVEHNLGTGRLGFSHEIKSWREAKPYLDTIIGGHGLETVGSSVMYAKEKLDGIIHIYPFGCMPEIVARSILPTISKDYDIPILSLVVDEMTGEAGYQTRLEAFTDLLKKRKQEDKYEKLLLRN